MDFMKSLKVGKMQLCAEPVSYTHLPWAYIQIDPINGEAAGQILDWYTEHGFYDMADIEEIIEADGSWYAKLLYDHSDQIAAGTGIYDPAEGQLSLIHIW